MIEQKKEEKNMECFQISAEAELENTLKNSSFASPQKEKTKSLSGKWHINEDIVPSKDDNWYPLDNAAKIYPANKSRTWNMVFRISVVLNDNVQLAPLQQALEDTVKRFPTFDCVLKAGVFWFYLQKTKEKARISQDGETPCLPVSLKSEQHLFRVTFKKNRIGFEVFHCLTDGTGAVLFVNTLMARYFELTGHKIASMTNRLDINNQPTVDEMEDSYARHADLKSFASRTGVPAFTLKGKSLGKNTEINLLNMKEDQLKATAKKYDCSITHFLSAVLIKASQKCKKNTNSKKPIVLEIPINLRTRLQSETVRNFAYFAQIGEKNDNATLQEIIDKIKSRLAECTEKDWLVKNINTNIRDQKSPILGAIPLCFKTFGMKLASRIVGEIPTTVAFSAIGRVKTPDEFQSLVDRYEFLITPSLHNHYSCSSISFNNHYVLAFTRNIKSFEFEKNAVEILTKEGVEIVVESNTDNSLKPSIKRKRYNKVYNMS